MDLVMKAKFIGVTIGLSVGLLVATIVFVSMLVSQNSSDELYREAVKVAGENPLGDVALRHYDGMKIHEFEFSSPNSYLLLVDNPDYKKDSYYCYDRKRVVIQVQEDAYRFFCKRGCIDAIEFSMWKDFQQKERERYLKPTKEKEKEEY